MNCSAVGRGARLSRIAPVFLTSALFAYKFLVENVPAANAIADDVGSFDSVRLSPHSAQDDNFSEVAYSFARPRCLIHADRGLIPTRTATPQSDPGARP